MKTNTISTCLAIVTVALPLLFTACNRQPAATVSAPQFADVPIRVSDSITSRPIAGAVVSPFCMGGTPYSTNTYTTDAEGIARVTFYAGASIVGVLVKMHGYETANIAVPLTNTVVALRRIQR